jgi:predicted transcriptional regulator
MNGNRALADRVILEMAVLNATPWPLGARAAWVVAARDVGWTLEQVARVLGVTRERVRQIEIMERGKKEGADNGH